MDFLCLTLRRKPILKSLMNIEEVREYALTLNGASNFENSMREYVLPII